MRYHFKNPSNGRTKASSGSFSWLLVLLFLEVYLLVKGNFRHFLLFFFLWLVIFYLEKILLHEDNTFLLGVYIVFCLLYLLLRVIYAFIIDKINAAHYLRQGWHYTQD